MNSVAPTNIALIFTLVGFLIRNVTGMAKFLIKTFKNLVDFGNGIIVVQLVF